ncbi:MAG: hypothetical protein A2289_05395 [Deltaproteobacteria bacterium RIFOXYA12_FULL_58_15]|nr:MAG: hypothetical protein A2289_05395 [Deltaproteobacteria bacterium RIFOXYA12_FULL_58_15]OGR08512.1 MAG: hypothetical protein A2341_03020 [Deltaproteobacteria bacterium RIFOXYB12_FULL_58_9]
MIYVDTSIVLAELLSEDRRPDASLWQETLVCSRLLEFELWTRLFAYGCGDSHGEAARGILLRLSFLEMVPTVLKRALEPFPKPVRTLDALHLSSFHYLLQRCAGLRLATFDTRMAGVANALGFSMYPA